MSKPAKKEVSKGILFFLTTEEHSAVKRKSINEYNSERALARYLRKLVQEDIKKKD